MSKLALRAQTVDIANLPFRQDLLAKKRFNDRSKEFLFGQRPVEKLPHNFRNLLVGILICHIIICSARDFTNYGFAPGLISSPQYSISKLLTAAAVYLNES